MGKSEGLLECASSFQILHVLNIFLAKELAGFANRCRAGSVVSMSLGKSHCGQFLQCNSLDTQASLA